MSPARAPGPRKRVGILISGGGSNMAALIAAARDPAFPAEIALVVSNRANAGGLAKAEAAGVATTVIDHKQFSDRESFDRAVDAALNEARVDILCMAGFMRIVSNWFAETWRDRALNIHPALLPAYTGLHTHARAIADGVKLAGATVHFVRPELDVGPIIIQAAVPVLDTDTPDALAARVLVEEHRIYPQALAWVASGRASVVRRDDGTEHVVLVAPPPTSPALVSPALDD
ncbi:MAG: phosphoribosylglycinamide formyltransferase [Ancalomicrobiaceae bacterium]|nr:phosphoribosylglycinamide formyltransferase [Ancalomicrobiaceae bacterium]